MTAGWVAASTRGRALLRRLVGPAGARELARVDTWHEARAQLTTTFYGAEMPADADRAAATRTATAATIWQLRVLAGWLPVGANGLARLLAAPIEIANIESHLTRLTGAATMGPVSLGSLAVAWPRVATTTSNEQVRTVLTHSAWGDPGGADPVAVAVGLRVAWARRLVHQVPETAPWAKGGLAVLIAREVFAFNRDISLPTGRELDRLIGSRWRDAKTIPELARLLPDSAAWALSDIASPSMLWRAELGVVHRVTADATRLAAAKRFTRSTVAAMMALLLVDLWRVAAAIELVGRGPYPTEVFDAVA
jgi:hypothetical protein